MIEQKAIQKTIKLEEIEQVLPTPAPTPTPTPTPTPINRSRQSSCETSDSSSYVRQSPRKRRTTSKLSDDDLPKRPRGRPPKTEPDRLTLTERRTLSSSDLRNKELRLKNNEASRRSRANRKGKEHEIVEQLRIQEKRYNDLLRENEELEQQVILWKKRVFKLATIDCST